MNSTKVKGAAPPEPPDGEPLPRRVGGPWLAVQHHAAHPARAPQDVTVVIEMSTACHQDSPYDTAIIPKVNETDRYPSAIGIPAVSPRL